MKDNLLFSDKQFGFIGGRSTSLQLFRVLDRCTEILDRGGCVDVIYYDFMKAFDTVPHGRLIQVLEYYSFDELHRQLDQGLSEPETAACGCKRIWILMVRC